MTYTTSEIAKISGVSSRTLRYYDQIDLLKPNKIDSNGYRVYTTLEIDKLQLILFYRELGISLEEIRRIIHAKPFDKTLALEKHLITLVDKKLQIEQMILTVTKTITAQKEGIAMSNKEKFECFKKNLMAENEKLYGEELREKYGDLCIESSNQKLKNINEAEYNHLTKYTSLLNTTLKEAYLLGNPASELAQKACELHKQILLLTWPHGLYSKESHLALVEGFTQDERFIAYYDNIAIDSVYFFYEAIKLYCK